MVLKVSVHSWAALRKSITTAGPVAQESFGIQDGPEAEDTGRSQLGSYSTPGHAHTQLCIPQWLNPPVSTAPSDPITSQTHQVFRGSPDLNNNTCQHTCLSFVKHPFFIRKTFFLLLLSSIWFSTFFLAFYLNLIFLS